MNNLVPEQVQLNTLLQQAICKNPVMAASHHNVIVQNTHDEWSSVTSPGLLIIGLSSFNKLAGGCACRQKCYHNINQCYCPVVIAPLLVLCLRPSTEVNKSALPVTLQLS